VLLLGVVLCAALALWTAVTNLQAKRCIDGELRSDIHGAAITERGCEITTSSGKTVLVPIEGPPFEVGVAAVCGFIVLVVLMVIVVTRRHRHTSSRHS
jgi:hypothetical protein